MADPAFAQDQDQETGGVLLTFGVEQGLHWRDNPDLDIPATGRETTSRTRLRFGFVTETRTQRLAFNAEGTLLAGDTADTGPDDNGLVSPSATLSYRLENVAAALELETFLRDADVDTLDFITGTDDLGAPVTTSVDGTGTRRLTGATALITFGRAAPFGGTFSLGRVNTSYTKTTDPDLIDNQRTTAQLSLRFDLTTATSASLALSAAQLEETGAPREDTQSVTLGLNHSLPDGAYTASLTLGRNDDGTRTSLSFGRSLDLPAGQLAASLGISRPVNGKTQGIATLDWRQDLPNGTFRLGLARNVTGNDREEETRVSRLTLSYVQDLTPTLGLNLSVGLQDSRETLTGLSSSTTNLSASLRHDLTADWNLNLGATHRIKNEDGVGRAKSTSIFLTLGRDFQFRP